MKAVTIVSFGGVEGLEVREVADAPRATLDRVRVRVRAAGLNRADILQTSRSLPRPARLSAGHSGNGIRRRKWSEVGEEARPIESRQSRLRLIGGGGQAEYVTVPESTLAEIPANLDWAEAAAVPEVFITAHDALFTQCGLQMASGS